MVGKRIIEMNYSLKISGIHHTLLINHLFPGDDLEAVALAICGRHETNSGIIFLVHEVITVPYSLCAIRTPDRVTWSTEGLSEILQKASRKGLSILKIHSHPGGFSNFSTIDDQSDKELFTSVFGWFNEDHPHISAVMLPGGEIFGRAILSDLFFVTLKNISVAGNNILSWGNAETGIIPDFSLRTRQAFGEGTVNKLKNLTAVVAGCSGTGSPVIEQLARLGVGRIILIDPDNIEKKNLNRIYNSTMRDAILNSKKVGVLKRAIDRIGLGTEVIAFEVNLYDSIEVLMEIANADVIFGCMDSVDGRHLLNQVATFYLIPYFDIGIKLISDGKGGIDQIMGTVHYLQPGGSTLLSRGVYTTEDLRAASIFRKDLNHYMEQKKLGYIADVRVESPAVISINTQLASMAVNEFLARIHLYRYDSNDSFAITRVSFTDAYVQYEKDDYSDHYLKKFIGRGDMRPYLNMPEF
ncbi:MAG TPA: ThiF family adenylyltransferase [Mucilaginibacter sp.]